MLSLQDISTSGDPNIDLEPFAPVEKDDSWAAMEFARFEWLFGLEHHGFPFESEQNVVTVSKDTSSLIRENVLRLTPMKDVIEKGLDIIQHNRNARLSERRGLHFAPKMASSTKRKRSHSIPSCDGDQETASSSTGTYASDIPSSDDDEESLMPLGDDKGDDFELDVESWAWKVIPRDVVG
ncbi:hypothetical protein VNI00_008090 [Paramarasmius palmivorus]|uniref:Uncharacterized protein n=1 Tax=Paramarasmius palmivorus TaxID=297713 RepID=A0AAW0D0Y2_9AGAR